MLRLVLLILRFGTAQVQFVTQSRAAAAPAAVLWGLEPEALLHRALAKSFEFKMDKGRLWYNHVAKMTGLKPATKYYYRVISDANSSSHAGAFPSAPFHFRSQDTRETLPQSLPQFHVIYGDMGTKCAFTLCAACSCDQYCNATTCASNHTVGVVSEVGLYAQVEREATMILHVGDFAYNMGDDDGRVGDQFFRNIEQVAAYVVMKPC